MIKKNSIKKQEGFSRKERLSDWSQSAFSDRFFWLFLAAWFLPLLVSIVYILVNFTALPTEVPLFYSRVWGIGQLAKKGYVFLPTAGALLLGIFDFSLAISFHPRDRVFAYLLSGTASFLAILVMVTSLNIVNLMR